MIDVLFSTVLYSNKLDIDTQAIIKTIIEARPPEKSFLDKNSPLNKVTNVEQEPLSDKSLYVLKETKYQELKKIIDSEIKEYANNIMQYDAEFDITTSWFTKIFPNESSQYHRHSNSFLSGILYLNVDDSSGDITFEDFQNDGITVPCRGYNKLNGKTYTVRPENGLILIFPSKLWHMVGHNNSKIERNSLAFNIMPVGTVGSPEADSHMKIKLL